MAVSWNAVSRWAGLFELEAVHHWPYCNRKNAVIMETVFDFLPEASFGLRVLSLSASVCLCVSVCVCVRQPRACPCHKSSRVQARTIKFGQKVQKNLVKVHNVFRGDWSWPSRSNLTWKAKFTPFWACPRHNSAHIKARTIKFGQKM